MDTSKGVEIENSPVISAEFHYIRPAELRAGEEFLSVADNDSASMCNHIHFHSLPFFLSFSSPLSKTSHARRGRPLVVMIWIDFCSPLDWGMI